MAVVTEQSKPQASKSSEGMGLIGISLIGAVLVLVFAYLVLRGVPSLWSSVAASMGIKDQIVLLGVQVMLQLAAIVGLVYASSRLATGRKATGIRGGIFLMICVAFAGLFSANSLYQISNSVAKDGMNFGSVVAMLFYVLIIFLIVQMFRTGRFTKWSLALDQAGWFDTHSHKKTQGHKVRRLTILGILLIAGTGIWTLAEHNYLPQNTTVRVPDRNGGPSTETSDRRGDWVIFGKTLEPMPITQDTKDKDYVQAENRARPRVEGGFALLPDLRFTVPLLLGFLSLWLAWRVVNYPVFADFLIATEAEINKVSWSSRKALIRDTIVVLVSLFLLTAFLFVVDMFWGWFLSREVVNVLPTAQERPAVEKAKPITEW